MMKAAKTAAENLHTQSTLYTAYRLCKGLSVTSPELYYGLQNANMNVREQIPDDKEHALDLVDMEVFLFNANEAYG